MKIGKFWILMILLTFIISIMGCFQETRNNEVEKFTIQNENKSTNILANDELLGAEITVSGILSENKILTPDNLLKIVKSNNGNTVISIAGEIKKGSELLKITDNFKVLSVDAIIKNNSEMIVKRTGEVLLGDFDLSGVIDLKDFIEFAQAYGTYKVQHDIAPASKGTVLWADIYCFATPDGVVNLNDFIVFAQNFGKTFPTQNIGYLPGDTFEEWYGGPQYYSKWSNGPSTDEKIFPLAVWLQSPSNDSYKKIGINTYIGLWNGPTESQLTSVKNLGAATICAQNPVGLSSTNRDVIKGWMQIDEPDNAQNGTQDPVPTTTIIARYNEMKSADSSRPVYMNFGAGLACDAWYGRGNRTNHPEDYVEYAKGADIISFDIYPMNVFARPDTDASWFKAFDNVVAQNIWYVAQGVDKLRKHSGYKKPVWTWIETTNFNGNSLYALTPEHIKAEVWMALIHGANGIGYFCHTFKPTFIEAGLLANIQVKDMVSSINAQVTLLSPVLNTQTVSNGVTVTVSDVNTPVDTMVKRKNGYTYLFSVAMRPKAVTADFKLRGFTGGSMVEVVGENRQLTAVDGLFKDNFNGYGVHIYKIANK